MLILGQNDSNLNAENNVWKAEENIIRELIIAKSVNWVPLLRVYSKDCVSTKKSNDRGVKRKCESDSQAKFRCELYAFEWFFIDFILEKIDTWSCSLELEDSVWH